MRAPRIRPPPDSPRSARPVPSPGRLPFSPTPVSSHPVQASPPPLSPIRPASDRQRLLLLSRFLLPLAFLWFPLADPPFPSRAVAERPTFKDEKQNDAAAAPQPCASAATEASSSSVFTVRSAVRLCRRLLASGLCSGRSVFDPSASYHLFHLSASESKCLERGVKEVVKTIRLGNKLQREHKRCACASACKVFDRMLRRMFGAPSC
ncbi:unnamed protein product [Urochloa humidicola]